MLKGAAVVFVKTPGVSPLKTRLAAGIGEPKALAFYKRSLVDTEATLKKWVGAVPNTSAYWSVAEPQCLNASSWNGLPSMGQGDGGLGHRLHYVYSELKKSHDYVILLGADAPHMPLQTLIDTSRMLHQGPAPTVMGLTDDGGFYLFASRLEIPSTTWLSVPYSVSNTAQALIVEVEKQGPVAFLPNLFDVDTADELHRLAEIDPSYGEFQK